MADWFLGHAGVAYAAALIGGFIAVAVWETMRPLRPLTTPIASRWTVNLGLSFLNQGLLPLILPIGTLGAAFLAQQRGWAPIPSLGLPSIVEFGFALLLLDFLRWSAHMALHRIPIFWRFHRVHHSDLDYDCTIGFRAHPVEGILTHFVIVAGVLALGLIPIAVLASEVLTIAHGYFAHANVSLPARWDRALRRFLVTPDLHRVHHSVLVDESQSNLGSLLSIWDRLFRTYREVPRDGPLGMRIGLVELRDPRQLTLGRVLWMPLARLPQPASTAAPSGS